VAVAVEPTTEVPEYLVVAVQVVLETVELLELELLTKATQVVLVLEVTPILE
jgi:hypothetical protein